MLSLFDKLDILIIDEPRDDRDFSHILKDISLRRDDICHMFFLSDTYTPLATGKVFLEERCRRTLAWYYSITKSFSAAIRRIHFHTN
jgi:hypothetical protein